MITDYFIITEKSNRLQVIMITDYDYPISGSVINSLGGNVHRILLQNEPMFTMN